MSLFKLPPRHDSSDVPNDVYARHASDLGAVVPGDGREPNSSIGVLARVRRRWRLFVALPLAGVAALAVGIAIALVYYTVAIPNPMALRAQDATPVVRVLARDGSVLLERGQPPSYVPYDLIPPHMIQALVAIEDRRFFDHYGIDTGGLVRATIANLRARRYVQGGSTLTQQLAKNLFLTSERRLTRKFEEMLLALWLEVRLTKQDIAELYLNRVYFGGGAYGIEAAAVRFFGKSARNLTLGESVVLVGLLKAPSKLSPAANPASARSRARLVLAKMRQTGAIDQATEARAKHAPVAFQDPAAGIGAGGAEYAVDYVLERLPAQIGSGAREIVVETTIDAALQKHAQQIATALVRVEGEASSVDQVAVVMLDHGGEVLALVGGKSHAESQFNRATRARRQPGSAFKPFVFAAALEAGATPDSPVLDAPVTINGWSPRNEGGTNRGATTLRTALAHSINTVAVRLHVDNGPRRTSALARRLGIHANLREEPSLALGTSEVSLLELTAAYGAFASRGLLIEPTVIRRVRTGTGQVLYQRPERRPVVVMAPRTAEQMTDMLVHAVTQGTGRRAALARHASAGKTGTSQDYRDAWFVGYTGHLLAGVWLGNDSGKAMNRTMGGTLPAKLWHEIMGVAHEERLPLLLSRTEPSPPGRMALAPKERIDETFVFRVLEDLEADKQK